MTPAQQLDCRFESTWVKLSRQGWCDARQGAEYRRVRAEWIAAGRPPQITLFIVQRANLDSSGRGPFGVEVDQVLKAKEL